MMEAMYGLSIAKQNSRWLVYRDDKYVGAISRLGPLFNNLLAWEWHDHSLWQVSARDLILA